MSGAPPTQPTPDEPPQFDIEAARTRYRTLMRSWPMRVLYLILILVILFSWAFALASVFASDVEHLPGHDVTVPVGDCIWCHTEGVRIHEAPPMNHPRMPTCGFCHRQGVTGSKDFGGRAFGSHL
jgi:hypothetical protein